MQAVIVHRWLEEITVGLEPVVKRSWFCYNRHRERFQGTADGVLSRGPKKDQIGCFSKTFNRELNYNMKRIGCKCSAYRYIAGGCRYETVKGARAAFILAVSGHLSAAYTD